MAEPSSQHPEAANPPSVTDLLRAMNEADATVAQTVASALPALAQVVDAIVERLPRGGHVYYVGAGTSGRLGVLDASEWYPTFGTEHGLVRALIAGGPEAVFRSIEGAEDDPAQGAADLAASGAGPQDVVIGISASGTTPFMQGALAWAQERDIFTAAIVCHRTAGIPARVLVELPVGPEFVEGSSRLKAGTATKMALNLISTVAMIRLGRVHAGRMVQVRRLCEKLCHRAQDIVAAETGLSPTEAAAALAAADMDIKRAIVMTRLEAKSEVADRWLADHDGRLTQLPGAPSLPVSDSVDLPELFAAYAGLPVRRVIGLMSGTSLDGVHAALVEVSGSGDHAAARLVGFSHETYDDDFRANLLHLCSPEASVAELCQMNFRLGEIFARAALEVAEAHGGIATIHLIASHGQTVSHQPAAPGSTLQIGEPAVIVERTGVSVVADFRVADVAAGGEGAPLSAFPDFVLFRHPARGRAVQNIGGIANVTFLPPGCRRGELLAFDTGPGNMLIDAVTQSVTNGRLSYDEDGALAARGRVDEALLKWLMEDAFIQRAPPKTAGREEFGAALAGRFLGRATHLTPEDAIATATAFTAEAIADAYRRFLLPRGRLDEIILGGGGAYNSALRAAIERRLPGVAVHTHEDFGIPGHAKEALSFALLGNETMLGRASGVPAATGAERAVLLGKILPGRRPLPGG